MKTIKIFLSLIFLTGILLAQDEVKKLPGYVDFGSFEGLYNEDNFTEVNVEAPLLNLAAKMSKDKDPELARLLSGIKLVKVYSFGVEKEKASGFEDKIKKITQKLNADKWERIVRVKEKSETVNVYLKPASEGFSGLTVLTLDSNEAVFVNVVGEINLEAISKLGERFDIPELDYIKKKDKK